MLSGVHPAKQHASLALARVRVGGRMGHVPRTGYITVDAGFAHVTVPARATAAHVAMRALRLVLASVAQHVALTLDPRHPVVSGPQMPLRPPAGITMRVQRRT